ncbi:MAG: hypothetical protein ACTSUE_18200 [Promethearchaeota archaeon]
MEQNKKAIIKFVTYIILMGGLIVVGLVSSPDAPPIASFLPVKSLFFDFSMIFFVAWILGPIVASLAGTYLLTPIYLAIHKVFFRKQMEYGIQDLEKQGVVKTSQGFFPSLMALFIALQLSSNDVLVSRLLAPDVISGGDVAMPALFITTMFSTFAGMLLFAPVYTLLDSGVSYINKSGRNAGNDAIHVKNYFPIEARSVGGWYKIVLKGYSGIAVIITYYQFIVELMSSVGTMDLLSLLMICLLVFGMPFLMTSATIPSIMFMNKTREKRKAFTLNFARKIGITTKVKVEMRDLVESAASAENGGNMQ